ncbi:hypothetical protein MMC15_000409 [Xylographa vitiligo]|nr:hypothetical protein [Xylographa vitiligo]
MENSYLTPWTLSSNSSRGGTDSPIVADQRSSKRRRIQAHIPDLGGIQMTQRREASTSIARSPARSCSSYSIGFSDRKSTRVYEEKIEDKDVQVVRQPVCSNLQQDVIGDSEQPEMDPEKISRLMEMADSDSKLEHLVEVICGGKASVSEREEWNRYWSSLSPPVRLIEPELVKKYTAPVVALHNSPEVTPIPAETLHSVQPSNMISVHTSGSTGNKPPPRHSLTVLLDAVVANSPLFVSPQKSLVGKGGVVPVADPFAQAKRKRVQAEAEAELKERQKPSENIDTEDGKIVGRPIVPSTTSSVRRGSASLQTLSTKIQKLEGGVAEYQAELQRKNTKLQNLSAEVDRERSGFGVSLRKSKQQVAGLKIELEESKRVARVAQTKYRELRLKMERMPRPVSVDVPSTARTAQDLTDMELSNLRSEVSALRSLIAAKAKPYPKCDFVHRNLFLGPLVLCGTVSTVSRDRGRPPKYTSSLTESDAGTDRSEDNEKHTDDEEDVSLTRNERALRAFDKAIGLPQNPIPVRVDGSLAYRDGTRDANGRLPRAKNLFKVGRNVPGELK